jgi:hypothetical protein
MVQIGKASSVKQGSILSPGDENGTYDAGPSSGKMIIGICKNTIPGYSNGSKILFVRKMLRWAL